MTRIGKMKYRVRWLAPGGAVIAFRNGDKEAVARITVVAGARC